MGFFDLMRWLGRHANGLRQLKNPKLRSVIFNDLTSAKKVRFRVKRGKYENRNEKCCQALLKKNVSLCVVVASDVHYRSPLLAAQRIIGVSSYLRSTVLSIYCLHDYEIKTDDHSSAPSAICLEPLSLMY